MSSDGAIDKPRSVRPARGDDRGLAGIALGALLVLALVATVVMVFSDDPVWMRIGTLAALWAAFIGAFLVARYRRQAAAEAARVRDLHTVYELQLEREISARREHELVVEKDLRDSVRAETTDSIRALRHEIAALRDQLGQMGVTLNDERPAVGGDTAAGELGAGVSLPSVPSERVEPRRRAPEPTVTGVGRDVTPSTERTEKLSPVEAETARPAGAQDRPPRGPAVRPVARPRSDATTTSETSSGSDTPTPRPTESDTPTPRSPRTEPPSAESEPHSRHGEGGGLSVAELMARFGDDAPGRGHRHRRSAD
ncbi:MULTISPECIES: DUF6779 domain-containing protein [unclassified Dietzia]|uniref:DUF6779 domain-containing protein n=1 Tax=unclassified Dietzia TaxID=2617939 RepID=UPI000D21369F|nr:MULTISPECIES: DUF6779 domain-containing protein [unclassified Dietzia]AVZ38568.1 hypothetical protein CT688_02815 [Dietzia sp. JS16-p6b]QGW23641.1 hypothetical protein GJR88_00908 [Dietzia sp. DQ12-45-1b]